MNEISAFDVLLAIGFSAQVLLIAFPKEGIHIYISNCLLVTASCGMFSAWLLILEKRVPPKKSGTILILARTLSVGISMISPLISTLQAPFPHLITTSFCLGALIATRGLPKAGCYSSLADQDNTA